MTGNNSRYENLKTEYHTRYLILHNGYTEIDPFQFKNHTEDDGWF